MLGVADAKGKVTCAENWGLKRVRTLTQARSTSVYGGSVVSSDNWAVTFYIKYICKKKICEMKTVDFLKYTLQHQNSHCRGMTSFITYSRDREEKKKRKKKKKKKKEEEEDFFVLTLSSGSKSQTNQANVCAFGRCLRRDLCFWSHSLYKTTVLQMGKLT